MLWCCEMDVVVVLAMVLSPRMEWRRRGEARRGEARGGWAGHNSRRFWGINTHTREKKENAIGESEREIERRKRGTRVRRDRVVDALKLKRSWWWSLESLWLVAYVRE